MRMCFPCMDNCRISLYEPDGDCESFSLTDPASLSPSRQPTVSAEVAYADELSRLDMVTVLTSSAFVFPDFNVESKQLKETEFIVVHRRVYHLLPTDQYDWMYSCSCSIRRSQLVSALSRSLQTEPVELNNSICLHIKSICLLLLEYDSRHTIFPEVQEHSTPGIDHTYEDTTSLFVIQMQDNLIGVSMHEASSVGVLLKQSDGSPKCIICVSSFCEHATCMFIKRWPQDDPDIPELLIDFLEQDSTAVNSRNCLVSPVSEKKIPFDLPGCLRLPFLNCPEILLPTVTSQEGLAFLALLPTIPALNDDPCYLCGNRFREEDPREEGWFIKSVKMYRKHSIFDCADILKYFISMVLMWRWTV